MPHWNTQEILQLLADPRWTLTTSEPGGDVDTTHIDVAVVGGEHLHVAGFRDDHYVVSQTPDDVDLDMIEVTDGQDSRGGCNSDNENTCVAYGVICSRLRKAGFQVVPQMDDYF